MNVWDELIGRLTRRLEVDEELRLDVAREVRCHLEDSAAEFRAAGQSDAQAAASAAKALGEEAELTEQLWQANRGRIRVRGVLRWTARVTLLPTAICIVAVLWANLVGLGAYVSGFFGRGGWFGGPPWPLGPVGRLVCDPYVGVQLTEDQRWLLHGDPNAGGDLERAKSIADRWPDDPVLYADYVSQLLVELKPRMSASGSTGPAIDEHELAGLLAALHRGEQIDPDNGFYNMMSASLLVEAAGRIQEDPSVTYDRLTRDGIKPQAVWSIEITDPQRFQEGLAEFHRGLAKSRLTAYSVEMLRRRLAALPVLVRLIHYFHRLSMQFSVLLPDLSRYRVLSRSLLAYSRLLAAQGDSAQALQIPPDVRRLAAKLGAQADTLVGLLVAYSVSCEALGHEEILYGQSHRQELAEQARRDRMDEYAEFRRIVLSQEREEAARGDMSLLESIVVPPLVRCGGYVTPLRRAEQFTVVQVGLFVLLAGLVLLAVASGLAAVGERLVTGEADRGVLLFVGWRRLGRILLWAVVAPLAVYALYASVASACTGWVGLTLSSLGRIIVELAAVVAVVLGLVVGLSRSAIRQRAAELGLTVPPVRRWRDRPILWALTGAVALAVIVYLVGWWAGPFRRVWPGAQGDTFARVLCAAIGGMLVLWGVREWIADLPGPLWSRWRNRPILLALTGVTVLLVLAHVVAGLLDLLRHGRWFGLEASALPACLVVLSTVLLLLWFVREWIADLWRTGPAARFRRSVTRSMIPILAATVIVVGVALGTVLAVGEGYAISQMGKDLPMPDEIANSDFRLLKEHFVEMDRAFQAQEARHPDTPSDEAPGRRRA